MITGSKNLTPKTAMIMPQVKNLCCHLGVILSRTTAFTTALSKDKVTSKTLKKNTINKVFNSLPASICAAQNQAAIKPKIVTIIDSLKCLNIFLPVSFYIF